MRAKALILIVILLAPAMAYLSVARALEEHSITVQTDRSYYHIGDRVYISGRLTHGGWPEESVTVAISVDQSSGGNYYKSSNTTDENGIYTLVVTLGGERAILGEYTVTSSAEGNTSRTTFLLTDATYIKASGEVEPASAPVDVNGNIYTLKDNITGNSIGGIVIEKGSIILDGAGFTLNGKNLMNSNGISLNGVNNVTIKNITVTSFYDGISETGCSGGAIVDTNMSSNSNGIYLQNSNYNTIEGNSISTNTYAGIWLYGSHYNNISKNSQASTITSNHVGGIKLEYSSDNNIVDNYLTQNTWYGIYVGWVSYSNRIFHNNFLENALQALAIDSISQNVWDDGYPSGGNYWSNYAGADNHCGPQQNETGSDGIGDYLYTIDSNNRDNYPLMNAWIPTENIITIDGTEHSITTLTNATMTQVAPTPDALNFAISGASGQTGYVRVILPNINTTTLKVFINGSEPAWPFPTITSNGTHYFIYFELSLSTEDIVILLGTDYTLHLSPGWNLVSFPVFPRSDPSFSSIFSGVGYYQVVAWDGVEYVTPTTAEAGRGYWVLVLTETTVNFTAGVPVESYELDLPCGWSMIGSTYDCSANATLVFSGYHELVTWDGTMYVNAETIEPGGGYWTLVLEPTHIKVHRSCSTKGTSTVSLNAR